MENLNNAELQEPDYYLKRIPKSLLDDLIRNRWLPIVGAGMSANADVPGGKRVPLWRELSKMLSDEVRPGEPRVYHGELDAISAYEQVYNRTVLVERLRELLYVEEAKPGRVHRAFCSLPFDIVCTTNIDFLLERQYDQSTYCIPIVDQEQLSVAAPSKSLTLAGC